MTRPLHIKKVGFISYVQIFLILILIIGSGLIAQGTSNLTTDWTMVTAGKVHMVVHNRGRIFSWDTGYPGLIDIEYPPGSGEEHIGACGITFGGILPDGSIGISAGEHMKQPDEFWPGSAPWDTIWVVNGNDDPLDIGGEYADSTINYWPGYEAVSDQDFVCRYNDYNVTNPYFGSQGENLLHNILYVDVVQTVYSWANPPLDDIVLYTYYITPTRFEIRDPIFGFQVTANIGNPNTNSARDDRVRYYDDYKLVVAEDSPQGFDGDAISNAGFQIFPPDLWPEEDIVWTWIWNTDIFFQPNTDSENYRQTHTTGEIMSSQEGYDGASSYLSMYWPGKTLEVGDTLKIQMAIICSEDGTEQIVQYARMLGGLKDQGFRVPGSPPTPPLVVTESNRSIRLNWEPTLDSNPETYQDEFRLDNEPQPFEGYRIYKSTTGDNGPWTILAEYDIPNNDYGHNTGLQHEYLDQGLLNNIEYHYAVTAFSKPDTILVWPSAESSVSLASVTAIPGTEPPGSVGEVAVVPNPYRADVDYRNYNPPWEHPPSGRSWMPQDRRIQFINLPESCFIKIFTSSGNLVNEIEHFDTSHGYEDWNLTSSVGQGVSSGLYYFSVKDRTNGEIQVGKFVIIK